MPMRNKGNRLAYARMRVASSLLLVTLFILTAAVGIACGGGSGTTTAPPATTSSAAPAVTTSAAATTLAVPTTSAAAQTTAVTTKPTTAAATTAVTTKPTTTADTSSVAPTTIYRSSSPPLTQATAGEKPIRLVLDIEKMETSGFSTVWLRPLTSAGSIVVVEGVVDAKLTLILKDGTKKLTNTWTGISFDESNYTLMAKGAEVAFPYPNKEEHDYNEPGILQVTLTLKDGTKLSAELSNISLHPSVIS
jgi:hypothetical protein